MVVARASGEDGVTPGQMVTRRVDLAMFHDSNGPRRLPPLLAVKLAPWHSDAGARGARHIYDATVLPPQVALPQSPANAQCVDVQDTTRTEIAYIVACSGAELDDLRAAARALAARRIVSGVQLLVAPASGSDAVDDEREGVMVQPGDTGATLLPSARGACAGYGSRIPEGSMYKSSTVRNFEVRMGAATTRVYSGAPNVVVAPARKMSPTAIVALRFPCSRSPARQLRCAAARSDPELPARRGRSGSLLPQLKRRLSKETR